MTHPKVVVTVDGVPVSGVFMDRLVSLTVTDREGILSDSLEMEFSDGPPFFQSPRRGAVVNVSISYGITPGFVGSFIVDRVDIKCLPYSISVGAHSADLRRGLKVQKSRHWDDAAVKDIVTGIAGEHEMEVRISDAVSGHVYDWIGQQDESDLSFLNRLARRHSALFSIKNGLLMWLDRGGGATAAGDVLKAAKIYLPSIVKGSCSVSESDVDRYRKVKAYWQDRAGAKRQEVEVDADLEAEGTYTMGDPFGSREEAEIAAKACAREMLRGLTRTQCKVIGRPALMAGQPVSYFAVRPGIDGREFILETVQHTYTKGQGLQTFLEGKLRADPA